MKEQKLFQNFGRDGRTLSCAFLKGIHETTAPRVARRKVTIATIKGMADVDTFNETAASILHQYHKDPQIIHIQTTKRNL